jgi:excisionase family DNA binding protein
MLGTKGGQYDRTPSRISSRHVWQSMKAQELDMRTELEAQDIEAIAQRVYDLLRPALSNTGKRADDNTIFDVQGLADYLKVDTSWIYKQAHEGKIPCVKLGKYLRFKKSAIDKHIERSTLQAVSPAKLPKATT